MYFTEREREIRFTCLVIPRIILGGVYASYLLKVSLYARSRHTVQGALSLHQTSKDVLLHGIT